MPLELFLPFHVKARPVLPDLVGKTQSNISIPFLTAPSISRGLPTPIKYLGLLIGIKIFNPTRTSNNSLCCDSNQGIKSWEKLKYLLKKLNLENPQREQGVVLRSKVDCLRICKQGPILLVWPDGIWYSNVSPERIEKIIKRHILEGSPIKEWIFKETPLYLSKTF